MPERVCVLTGATSGIGRAAASALARQGFSLGLVCRSREKGERAAAEIRAETGRDDVAVFVADLGERAAVRRVAAELCGRYPRIDVLLNNAGLVNLRREETPDGLEATFAVNHLAYFLLTELLLDRLRESAPARIVSVASDAHRFGRLDLDDLEYRRRPYKGMQVYGSSKLLNILWSQELARRLAGSGVTANCLHPGGVNTGLGDNNNRVLALLGKVVKRFMRTPEQGADTAVWLATAPELEGVSGRYFADRKERQPSAAARDPEAAATLWQISEERARVGRYIDT
jgi:NAD(P)-dependent dehydrogenase (short-subunit alcohol dehydrogenase family)